MNPLQVYRVHLTRIEGEGDFPCPGCGVIISPDDYTQRVYKILEAKVKNGSLAEAIIQCNLCGSETHLTDFLLLKTLKTEHFALFLES